MNDYKFPELVYIGEPLNATPEGQQPVLDAYDRWDDCEGGDVVAEYRLVRVCKVKETKTKTLVEVTS